MKIPLVDLKAQYRSIKTEIDKKQSEMKNYIEGIESAIYDADNQDYNAELLV